LAWRQALDAEIAGYETSDQDCFAPAPPTSRHLYRALRALTEEDERPHRRAILYGEDIAPTRFSKPIERRRRHRAKAGSTASHVAMQLAWRAMVVGLGASPANPNGLALLDAEHGGIGWPSTAEIEAFHRSSSRGAAHNAETQGRSRR
jgi:phosphotransferase system enzyme I (PtsI)